MFNENTPPCLVRHYIYVCMSLNWASSFAAYGILVDRKKALISLFSIIISFPLVSDVLAKRQHPITRRFKEITLLSNLIALITDSAIKAVGSL